MTGVQQHPVRVLVVVPQVVPLVHLIPVFTYQVPHKFSGCAGHQLPAISSHHKLNDVVQVHGLSTSPLSSGFVATRFSYRTSLSSGLMKFVIVPSFFGRRMYLVRHVMPIGQRSHISDERGTGIWSPKPNYEYSSSPLAALTINCYVRCTRAHP